MEGINIIKLIAFIRKTNEDNVPAFSAQASFFLFISFFPFIILLISLVKYTPLTESAMLDFISDYIPNAIGQTLTSWIKEIYGKHTGILPLSAIAALWAASKGFMSICTSINKIYSGSFSKNYFIKRLLALLYTVFLIIILLLTALIIVFGDKLMAGIKESGKTAARITGIITDFRIVVAIAMFFMFFIILYRFIPFGNSSFKKAVPGAVFTTSGWLLFSVIYSIYVNNINMRTSIYGSLTTIILLMLWLYFCMYILLIGAEINVYLSQDE